MGSISVRRSTSEIKKGKSIFLPPGKETESCGATGGNDEEPQFRETTASETIDGKPRMTWNFSEEEAMTGLRAVCSQGKPKDRYKTDIELRAIEGGTVCLALDKNNKARVAVKKIDITKQDKKEMALMEIKVLKDFNHKNLINFIESYMVGVELSIVMEYLPGATLSDVVTECTMKEGQIATVCDEILQGLGYLHLHNILHRDIGSENVQLGLDGTVKLIDFGFCQNVKGDEDWKR